jgi:hypothetical protein
MIFTTLISAVPKEESQIKEREIGESSGQRCLVIMAHDESIIIT